jgi:hypothetical protein
MPYHPGHLLGLRHVHGEEAVCRTKFTGAARGLVSVNVGDQHPRALCREAPRCRPTDSAGRPRNQDDASTQFSFPLRSPHSRSSRCACVLH